MLGNLDGQLRTPPDGAALPVRSDLERLLELKNSCALARPSATRLNRAVSGRSNESDLENFREHAGEAVRLAREITDEIYRNSALFYLTDLFAEAGNLAYARRLFDVMHAGPVRDRLVRSHPQLGAAS